MRSVAGTSRDLGGGARDCGLAATVVQRRPPSWREHPWMRHVAAAADVPIVTYREVYQ